MSEEMYKLEILFEAESDERAAEVAAAVFEAARDRAADGIRGNDLTLLRGDLDVVKAKLTYSYLREVRPSEGVPA